MKTTFLILGFGLGLVIGITDNPQFNHAVDYQNGWLDGNAACSK